MKLIKFLLLFLYCFFFLQCASKRGFSRSSLEKEIIEYEKEDTAGKALVSSSQIPVKSDEEIANMGNHISIFFPEVNLNCITQFIIIV